jgi:YegS/Rv2252/BmrU family lipid kinase
MKHIFILNPAAGKGAAVKKRLPAVLAAAKAMELDCVLHRTTGPQEAEFYVRERCAEAPSERLRFYACGGDGTANEVANGIYGFPNAEMTVLPSGTGNDLVRSFASVRDFCDVERLVAGVAVPVDMLSYAFYDERTGTDRRKFAINMCNIGFDSEAVAWAERLKRYPFVGGVAAYIGGVGIALVHKKALNLRLDFDDGEVLQERILLTAIANGAYCGGGFKGAPDADPRDGILDVFIARDVTRRTFLSLLPKYRAGEHFTEPRAKDILLYKRCGGLRVSSDELMHIAVDGEVFLTRSASFKIEAKAIRFALPAEREPAAEEQSEARRPAEEQNEAARGEQKRAIGE